MKSIPERRFLRMIRDQQCTWTTTGSNEHAIWYKGKIISRYGVWHAKGSKREVGIVYVKNFIRAIKEMKRIEASGGDLE